MSKVKVTLTVEELSDILGVCQQTIRRWIHSGQLSGLKMNNRHGYCVTAADVTKFFENWIPPVSRGERVISTQSKYYTKWCEYLTKNRN